MPWAATSVDPRPASASASACHRQRWTENVLTNVRYACEIQPLHLPAPEPILQLSRSLEASFASSSLRYHVLCTHQDQVMKLSEGTLLLAGNEACKHGMV